MARVGLKDLFGAVVIEDKDGVVKYDKPFRIAKAIEATIAPQQAEAELYADDALAEFHSETTAYDITLGIDDLSPEVRGKLLGLVPDEHGMIVETNESNAPYVAIMFRAKRSDDTYEYRTLYKTRFNRPEDRYQTQGSSIEFQTDSVTAKGLALSNGRFGAYVIGTDANKALTDKWFTEPQGANEKAPAGGRTTN